MNWTAGAIGVVLTGCGGYLGYYVGWLRGDAHGRHEVFELLDALQIARPMPPFDQDVDA